MIPIDLIVHNLDESDSFRFDITITSIDNEIVFNLSTIYEVLEYTFTVSNIGIIHHTFLTMTGNRLFEYILDNASIYFGFLLLIE